MTLFQCKWYNDKRQRFKFVFVRFCNTICRALDENKVGCRKAARCCRKSASPDQIDYDSRERSLPLSKYKMGSFKIENRQF